MTTRNQTDLVLTCCLVASLLAIALPLEALRLPDTLDLGAVPAGQPVSGRLELANDLQSSVTVSLVPGCECLTVAPARLTLAPGGASSVTVTLDPSGYSGAVRQLLVVSDGSGTDRLVAVLATVSEQPQSPYQSTPGCEPCRQAAEEARRAAYEHWRRGPLVAHYYYNPDCATCADFLLREVTGVEERLGWRIHLDVQDVRLPAVRAELEAALAARSAKLKGLPVLVVGEVVLQGDREVRQKIEAVLRARGQLPGPPSSP